MFAYKIDYPCISLVSDYKILESFNLPQSYFSARQVSRWCSCWSDVV